LAKKEFLLAECFRNGCGQLPSGPYAPGTQGFPGQNVAPEIVERKLALMNAL
jgi:hypothetical protein